PRSGRAAVGAGSRGWRPRSPRAGCSGAPTARGVASEEVHRAWRVMKLFTIGYEGATQSAVIGALQNAGVEVLIDVRAVPASRRAGFSKKLLAASLGDAGVDYVHLQALGTPKAGREAARAGRHAEMRAIYEAHLAEPAAQLQLIEARDIASKR